MKTTLVTNLRASVLAASAASLTLIAPAFAEESRWQQHKNAQSENAPKFSQLDQNNDSQLSKEELQNFAEDKKLDVEQYLTRFDTNDDQALSESEFNQLVSASGQASAPDRMAMLDEKRAEQTQKQKGQQQQADKGDGAKVVVDQKPTQVTVDKPPAQVTIDQPKPKVTVTTRDPKVQVEQAEPRVSVQQPEPKVSVDQAKPEVEVQDAEPNVQVRNSKPQVQVNEQEPEVAVKAAEGQQRPDQSQQQSVQREQDSQRQQAAIDSREQMQGKSNAQAESIYALPISELRSVEIVNQEGETIGNVEEIVVKRDASEAGFIISTTASDEGESRHVYRSAEDFALEGDRIKLEVESGAEALREPQGFKSQEYTAAPNDDATLGELTNRAGISAR